jgi:hypothetical protein
MLPATMITKGRPMGMRLPMETFGTWSGRSNAPPTFVPHEVKEHDPLPPPKITSAMMPKVNPFIVRDSVQA